LQMPGRQPQKVDCTDDSTIGDVAVVMAISRGHEGGKKLVLGFLVLAVPWCGQCPDRVVEARLRVG
jgi:hypothetical protein